LLRETPQKYAKMENLHVSDWLLVTKRKRPKKAIKKGSVSKDFDSKSFETDPLSDRASPAVMKI
jgi:hypothetical protein